MLNQGLGPTPWFHPGADSTSTNASGLPNSTARYTHQATSPAAESTTPLWRHRTSRSARTRSRQVRRGTASSNPGELAPDADAARARSSASSSSVRTTSPTATAIPTGRPAVASAPTSPAAQYQRRSRSMNEPMAVSRNTESAYIAPYRNNEYGYSIRAAIAVTAEGRGSRVHAHRPNSSTAAAPARTARS